MRKLMFITLLGLTSCTYKEHRYEVHGKVYVATGGPNPMHDAIWYTDTINFDGDTIYYTNSDGSEVRIKPPYVLIDNTLNNK